MMLVLGGGVGPPAPATWNTYEALSIDGDARVFNNQLVAGISVDSVGLPGVRTFMGPGTVNGNPDLDWLEVYPRAQLIDDGSPQTKTFISGFPKLSAYVEHELTQGWNTLGATGHIQPAGGWNDVRYYGATVRYPNTNGNDNIIMRLGGYSIVYGTSPNPDVLTSTEKVETCQADAPGAAWQAAPSMQRRRAWHNVVILPDATLVAFGGVDMVNAPEPVSPINSTFLLEPEYLSPGALSWTLMDWAPAASVRDYHSTALLLPDGRVLVAGGNSRGADYEVFNPPYEPPAFGTIDLAGPGDATIVGTQPAPGEPYVIAFGSQFTAQCSNGSLPLGVFLQRAVLMAPGSTTHHSDMSQRYHQLAVTIQKNTPSRINCTAPANDRALPPGYYMLFVVTNTGKVSSAAWVQLP